MSEFFKLHPSYICSALLFFGYSLAIWIVFLLPIVWLAKAAIAVLLVCALAYYLYRDVWLLLSSSPVAIRIEGKDIMLLTQGGSELRGSISSDSTVTPFLTILHVLQQTKKDARYAVIFPDSMDKEVFRKLRVLLKWGI